MRIAIFLAGRYPTEKAYGVTTRETAVKLLDHNHEVIIYCLKSTSANQEILAKNITLKYYHESGIARLFKFFAFSSKGFIGKCNWIIFWKLLYFQNRKSVSNSKFDIAWFRDNHLLKFSRWSPRVVMEIHQMIGQRKIQKSIRILKDKKFVLAPISMSLNRRLTEFGLVDNVIFSPMGVNSENFADSQAITNFVSEIELLRHSKFLKIKAGYVGKFYPNGYSKGVEDLLLLAMMNKDEDLKLEIAAVGGSQEDVAKLKSKRAKLGLTDLDLKIGPHLPHKDALNTMKKFHAIVLPSPESKKYYGFPLKCMEAVASARILAVADCPIYRDIFSSSYQPYWYQAKNPESLFQAILSGVSDQRLEENLKEGLKFASRFSWENRTSRILKYLESV